jgi:hypothetical protein
MLYSHHNRRRLKRATASNPPLVGPAKQVVDPVVSVVVSATQVDQDRDSQR